MKKTNSFAILSFLAISLMLIGMASAETFVSGKIYNSDLTQEISGANVTIDCNGNMANVISKADGSYAAEYDSTQCKLGDSLTVYAQKGDLYGSNTGIVEATFYDDWDLAIVRVALVPEFGLIAGLVTVLGAVGVFFFVRRD